MEIRNSYLCQLLMCLQNDHDKERNIFITYWDSSSRSNVGGSGGNIAVSTEWKEHIEGLHMRINTLKDIQFSLIAYLTSTESSKVISDSNVIIIILAFFFDAVEVSIDTHTFTHSFIHSFTHLFTHSFIHSFIMICKDLDIISSIESSANVNLSTFDINTILEKVQLLLDSLCTMLILIQDCCKNNAECRKYIMTKLLVPEGFHSYS